MREPGDFPSLCNPLLFTVADLAPLTYKMLVLKFAVVQDILKWL